MKYIKCLGYWLKGIFIQPKKNKHNEYKRLKYSGYKYLLIYDFQQMLREMFYNKPSKTIKPTDTRYAYSVQRKLFKLNSNNSSTVMGELIRIGYSPDDVGIVLTNTRSFCGLWFSEKDFWVIYGKHHIVKASEFFKNRKIKLMCGFNLNEMWDL